MEKVLNSASFDIELLKVPLEALNEPFVPVEEINDIAGSPLLFSEGLAPHERYLRGSVAQAVVESANQAAGLGYRLEILSAYRSLERQRNLFIGRIAELRDKGVSEDGLLEAANTYTAGIPLLAAHTAGSAVDVRLRDRNGQIMDFGTQYRDSGNLSHTLSDEVSPHAQANRQFLLELMQGSGFANYPFEWWHFSIGDVCWAYVTGQPNAFYAPAEYNPDTQATSAYDADLRAFFDGTQ